MDYVLLFAKTQVSEKMYVIDKSYPVEDTTVKSIVLKQMSKAAELLEATFELKGQNKRNRGRNSTDYGLAVCTNNRKIIIAIAML